MTNPATRPTTRHIPIHRSLTRPLLLGGAERELTLLNATVIVILLFGGGLHVFAILTALALGTLGQGCFIQAAKVDPKLWQIYRRHLVYQDFYSAQTSVLAKPARIKPAFSIHSASGL